MIKKIFYTLLFAFCSFVAFSQVEEPVKWRSSVKELGDGEYELTMKASIESPWYMYDMNVYEGGPNGTAFSFNTPEGGELIGEVVQLGTPTVKYDEMFGMDIGHFKDSALFVQKVKVTSDEVILTANVEWMSCSGESCLAPTDHDFLFKLKGDSSNAASAEGSSGAKSMWSTIIAAILWGFAALLTPCVFPMVPMTVSFFMKSSGSKSKGRTMASFYGLSIVALYTIPIAVIILITYIFGGDTVTADIFNWLSTHWIPNVLFFLIFMIFAASFFGAFEIVMPSKLVNKSDAQADKGGFIGVFFMALTLVLVSFSCTGPIVGSILVQSTQGDIWEPIITMLVFSAAFALPFTVLAFFPSLLKNLPKSGGWLNSVKVVLGFIEVALGLKFLSVADQTYHWGILNRDVYISIWIVVFVLLGLYLLGKIRFVHDSEHKYVKVKSLFMAIVSFSFAVYLVPGLFGAPLKALSGYLPPMHTLDFNLSEVRGVASAPTVNDNGERAKYSDFLHLPHSLQGFFDYEEGMAYAKKVGKPVMLDFTGHGCVNCREMEASVWSDPSVLKILNEDYVVIALYVDDKKVLPESDWVTTNGGKMLKSIGKINADFQASRFGVNGQPYYILLDDEGKELAAPRGYNTNIAEYIQFLKQGVESYNKTK